MAVPTDRITSSPCVFCLIVAGATPARIVYETGNLVCLFPLEPEVLGHTLIVSREHYEHIGDCPATLGEDVFAVSQKLAHHYRGAIGASGFNLMNANGSDANQSVGHLHFHFLPRIANDELNTWPDLPPFSTDLDALFNRLKIPA